MFCCDYQIPMYLTALSRELLMYTCWGNPSDPLTNCQVVEHFAHFDLSTGFVLIATFIYATVLCIPQKCLRQQEI